MEDMKDKMKSIIKKANKPFSSSSSAFKGQGRVLGSATSSSSSSLASSNSTASRILPISPIPSTTAIKKSARASATVECPICSSSFASEESVSAHIDSCAGLFANAESDPGVANLVNGFLSSEPVESSVEIVIKLLRNVVREPGNEKFRRIRMGNPKIKEAIGDVSGGVELLEYLGFMIETTDGEKWATMGEPTQEMTALMREAVLLMERWKDKDAMAVNGSVEKFAAEKESEPKTIDRKVRVFFSVSESVAAKVNLPDSFYNLSVEELRREADARRKKIADSQLLVPRSYKEKKAMAARKKYNLTVIRIQFPDGVVLQGVFLPWERTTVLYEFVVAALKEGALEFDLLSVAAPRVHLIPRLPRADGRMPTLEDENLIPSALIKFKPIETDSVAFTGLSDQLLELMEPLAT